jgi:hypothetical protein
MLYSKELIFNRAPVTQAWRRMLRRSAVLLLLLAGVACAGTKALAQEIDTVYQLRSDGTIRQNTCSGNTCQGATLLDNNPAASSITSGDGGLFQMHSNGSIWHYTGQPCTSTGCPGWAELDNNSQTRTIAAGGFSAPYLFQLHFSGSLFQSTGAPCNSSGCLGWVELDSNLITQIVAAGGTQFLCFQTSCPPNIPPLVQLHSDGSIWQYTGTPCNSTSCPGWQKLDNNPAAVKIFGFADGGGGTGSIFQLHSDGSIWRYTGQPCSGNSCPGWKNIASAPSAKIIMTAETSGRLFVMNNDGSVWELTTSSGWVELNNSSLNISIAASNNGLFRLQSDGSIFYLGSNGWVLVDSNPAAKAIAATSFIQTK